MITDKDLRKKLSRSESRELLNLIRKYHPISKDLIDKNLSSIRENEKDPKLSKLLVKHNNEWKNKILDISRIYFLYEKGSFKEHDLQYHWIKSYQEQLDRSAQHRRHARSMKPLPKQDNKGYINGNGGSNGNKIRYPKKKRKSAWKRFYKLFPHLKPDAED